MTFLYVWLGLLTLALAAHMIRDAREFSKIRRLQDVLSELKAKREAPAAR